MFDSRGVVYSVRLLSRCAVVRVRCDGGREPSSLAFGGQRVSFARGKQQERPTAKKTDGGRRFRHHRRRGQASTSNHSRSLHLSNLPLYRSTSTICTGSFFFLMTSYKRKGVGRQPGTMSLLSIATGKVIKMDHTISSSLFRRRLPTSIAYVRVSRERQKST